MDTISKSILDTTINYIDDHDWHTFQPFDLIIHNLLQPPLPFTTKQQFLMQALNTWQSEISRALPVFDDDTSLHERLFEVGMTRFEFLDPYKKFLKKLCKLDMLVTSHGASHVRAWLQSIQQLYDYAVNQQDLRHTTLDKLIFPIFYLKTLSVWLDDHSSDLNATMAAWDKNVTQFLKLSQRWS